MASGETFVRVAAFHPNWRGILRLAVPGDAIFHERAGSTGKYRRASGKLTVIWDDYQPDVFFEQNGRFIHEAFVRGAPPIEQIVAAGVGGQPVVATRLSVVVPGTGYEVMLRLGTSDSDTFEQIFIAGDYDSPNLPDNAATIVDLGANIGLATVFFGLRFPQARILAVEPDAGNAAALATNTAALGDRVRVCRAAVWVTDGIVNLHTESTDGTPLGAWGIQVSRDGVSRAIRLLCAQPKSHRARNPASQRPRDDRPEPAAGDPDRRAVPARRRARLAGCRLPDDPRFRAGRPGVACVPRAGPAFSR